MSNLHPSRLALQRFKIKKHPFDPEFYSRLKEGQKRFEREELEAALRAGARHGGMTPATDEEIREFYAVEDDYGDRGDLPLPTSSQREIGGQYPLD